MLLSALKILIFLAAVLVVALGVGELADRGHALRLVYDGTEYVLGPGQTLVALLVVVVLGWLLLRLVGLAVAVLRFLLGDETAINRHFARTRQRKGYDALADGMLAVASGEGRIAQEKAARAARFLDRHDVTDLLAAQAAEVSGDRRRAAEVYRRLLSDERTRFVGIRGLMRQKLDEGDTETALKLAQKAYAIKPRHAELQDTLLALQTRAHDWKGARAVLRDKRRQGLLPQDVHIRRDAVLATQEAAEVLAQTDSPSAREAAISAHRASPDLVPAALLAAQAWLRRGDARQASRVLQKTWSLRPHPALAAAYAAIVPDETPAARLRRFEDLIRQNPDHEESRLLRAELLLAAEDFPGARRALGDLPRTHPTVRALAIEAAVERGSGAPDQVVRGILARALVTSRGPQWVCDKCQGVMAEWSPICDHCGSLDTLSWREPPEGAAPALPEGTELLPLLAGDGPPRPAPPQTVGQGGASDTAKGGAAAASAGQSPTPGATPPGPANAASAPGPATAPSATVEIADVPPGIVPRESDWRKLRLPVSEGEPVMTVTDPEPPLRQGAAGEPTAAAPAPEPAAESLVAPAPARIAPSPVPSPASAGSQPAAEPGPSPTSAAASAAAPAPERGAPPARATPRRADRPGEVRIVSPSDLLPVRPDVEPPPDDTATGGKMR